MKIVAVVPIKLNSERLLNKNIRLLGGKPLIHYILETLNSINEINDRYVYCSDKTICDYLIKGVSFLKRSDNLDLPTSNFTQIFSEFSLNIDADIYVYAHATAPYVEADTIRNGISAVVSGQYDSAFCAQKLQDFLWYNQKPLNFDPKNIPRSQDLPVYYRETSGVYIFKKEVFEKYKSRIGEKPFILEVGHREAVDINTLADFIFAEQMLHFKGEKL